MPLNNKEYWEKRALLREQAGFENALDAEKKLSQYYKLSTKAIRSKIADLYAQYAKNNQVTYAQAMEYLNASKAEEWRYEIEEYVAKIILLQGNDPEKAAALLAELNRLSANSRIRRMEALNAIIDAELGILALKQEADTEKAIKNTFEESYYKAIFDVQQGTGYATTFSMLDTAVVTSALNYPWSGLSYSERIWANRDQLSRELKQEITTGLIKGASIREMAEAIDNKTDKGYKNAVRLVRTEVNYFENAATMDGYKECDIDQYQYLATLDSRTSETCQRLDLKIFNVKDAMPGTNMPPMHPHCRSTTVPYFADDNPDLGIRIARDKDSKNIQVPADMTYKEWYNEYVVTPQKEAKIREKIKSGEISKIINPYRQNRHIPGTEMYTEGKSILTGDAQTLINKFAGTGKFRFTKAGEWSNKEVVDCGEEIGIFINKEKTFSSKTTMATIHYSKHGTHIVPAVPNGVVRGENDGV